MFLNSSGYSEASAANATPPKSMAPVRLPFRRKIMLNPAEPASNPRFQFSICFLRPIIDSSSPDLEAWMQNWLLRMGQIDQGQRAGELSAKVRTTRTHSY